MLALRRAEISLKFFEARARRQVALDLILERFEKAWHGNKYGNALALHRANHFGRIERVQKNDGGAENLGDENAE